MNASFTAFEDILFSRNSAQTDSSAQRRELDYLGNPPDVLIPVLLREAEVAIEAKADVIAVESVRGEAQVEQVLLERRRDGRFPRPGQTREPDREAALLAQLVALVPREGGMPCYISIFFNWLDLA